MYYTFLFYFFEALNFASLLSVLILLVIYIRVGRNVLLICSCFIIIIMNTLIIFIPINFYITEQIPYVGCNIQGVVLNHCFITIHGLLACMMFDAWSHVSHFRIKGTAKDHFVNSKQFWTVTYLVISFGIPLIPTIILIHLVQQFSNRGSLYHDAVIIQPHAYFCYISGAFAPKILTSTGWFMLFSIPGLFFSVFLLFKTIWMRQKSIRRGRTTHLTKFSVIRVGLATFVYSGMALSTFVPTLLFFMNDPDPPANLFASDTSSGKSKNSSFYESLNYCSLCENVHDDLSIAYLAYQRCPGVASFVPAIVGIGFYLMYGFGKHARKMYSDCLYCLLHPSIIGKWMLHKLLSKKNVPLTWPKKNGLLPQPKRPPSRGALVGMMREDQEALNKFLKFRWQGKDAEISDDGVSATSQHFSPLELENNSGYGTENISEFYYHSDGKYANLDRSFSSSFCDVTTDGEIMSCHDDHRYIFKEHIVSNSNFDSETTSRLYFLPNSRLSRSNIDLSSTLSQQVGEPFDLRAIAPRFDGSISSQQQSDKPNNIFELESRHF